MNVLKKYWPTAVTLLVILYATWLPHPVDPADLPPFPHFDKLIHAVMMGGLLGAVLFDERRSGRRLTRRLVTWSAVAVAVFSVVDEVVQGLLPIGRPSDWLDLAADFAGIAVAMVAAVPAVNFIFRRSAQP